MKPFSDSRRMLASAGVLLAIFLVHARVYSKATVPAIYNHGDNFWYVPTAQSLLHHGSFDLTADYAGTIEEERAHGNWMVVSVNGRNLNYYPAGTSLLALPIVILGNLRFASVPAGMERDFLIAAFVARVLAILSSLMVFVPARILTGRLILPAALSLIFGLTTPHLSIHAGGLWSHNILLFLSLVAMTVLVFRNGTYAGWSIVPLALAFLARPTAAIPIALVFLMLMWRRDWRSVAIFSLLGILSLAGLLLFWHSLYGQFVPSYFAGEVFSHNLKRYGFRFPEAVAGLLFSPNRGLFVFMPAAILSMLSFGFVVARRLLHPEDGTSLSNSAFMDFYILCGAWVVVTWLVAALNPNWWYGYSFGPRPFAEVLGALILLLIPGWEWTFKQRPPKRMAVAVCATVFVAAGLFANWRGATSPGTAGWNSDPVSVDVEPSRVWDWRDMQILR